MYVRLDTEKQFKKKLRHNDRIKRISDKDHVTYKNERETNKKTKHRPQKENLQMKAKGKKQGKANETRDTATHKTKGERKDEVGVQQGVPKHL